jgi:putative oxidoreductase
VSWNRISESDAPAPTAIIGIPSPQFMVPLVGSIEVVCGLLSFGGLLARLSSSPLIIVIFVAIASTKVPILLKSGFWPIEAEARTDYAVLLGLLYLLLVGAGSWSVDARPAGTSNRGNP